MRIESFVMRSNTTTVSPKNASSISSVVYKIPFTIWTQPGCSYCEKAKALLREMGELIGREYIIGRDITVAEFKEQGYTTVPQIWHGSRYIGGYSELASYLEETRGGFGDGI
jgi:glutaredoxin